jgi:hypothetical protein
MLIEFNAKLGETVVSETVVVDDAELARLKNEDERNEHIEDKLEEWVWNHVEAWYEKVGE